MTAASQPPSPDQRPPGHAPADSTTVLLQRVQAGDEGAMELLLARYLPRLRRWARGRLPQWARDLADTNDLVQDTLVRTFRRLDDFENRGDGALDAYLRQVLLNRIREEIRRAGRRVEHTALSTGLPADQTSPLEAAVGSETWARYRQALTALRPLDREIVVARVELGWDNDRIAQAFGKPSANAARMAVERALFRLAREMRTP
ncbi:MAG: sigma-70 family RNA polymerase sigma factor [Acidobacteriota bacterium]|nr:sigma-70 family RNA polymerase sigma factor [Acidobacteriota bacterium]